MNATTEASRISFEQSLANSVLVGGIAWAVHAVAFVRCAYTVCSKGRRSAYEWLPIVCTMFGLATVSSFSGYKYYILAFIKERTYPGGPLAFWAENQSNGWNVCAWAFGAATVVLSSAFLIYRFYSLRPVDHWVQFYTLALAAYVVFFSVLNMRTLVRLSHGLSVEKAFNDAVPFISVLLIIPQGLFTALQVTIRRAGGPEYKTIADPAERETVMHYLSLAICVFPLVVLFFVTAATALFNIGGSTGHLRVMSALGLQLMPTCAELVITWIVEPPDEMKEALRGSFLPTAL